MSPDKAGLLSKPRIERSRNPRGKHRATADGTRAENELDYQLTVQHPIYLRWWFLLLAAVAVLWGGFHFYRFEWNRKLAEKETQRLQQLNAAQPFNPLSVTPTCTNSFPAIGSNSPQKDYFRPAIS